jgi:hypothetical protein
MRCRQQLRGQRAPRGQGAGCLVLGDREDLAGRRLDGDDLT